MKTNIAAEVIEDNICIHSEVRSNLNPVMSEQLDIEYKHPLL